MRTGRELAASALRQFGRLRKANPFSATIASVMLASVTAAPYPSDRVADPTGSETPQSRADSRDKALKQLRFRSALKCDYSKASNPAFKTRSNLRWPFVRQGSLLYLGKT